MCQIKVIIIRYPCRNHTRKNHTENIFLHIIQFLKSKRDIFRKISCLYEVSYIYIIFHIKPLNIKMNCQQYSTNKFSQLKNTCGCFDFIKRGSFIPIQDSSLRLHLHIKTEIVPPFELIYVAHFSI